MPTSATSPPSRHSRPRNASRSRSRAPRTPARSPAASILFIAKTNQPEPRLALTPRGPAIFAVDIDQLRPDQPAVIDDKAIGYPFGLADLPPGDYYAQAVINVYEQVRRADGKTIWVHLNDGRVEFFNNAVGQPLQRRRCR